jgi:hypothetical protein
MAIPASTDAGDRSEAVGLPQHPPSEKTNVIGQRGRKSGLSETSDDYPRVVAVLSDGKTRVIVCYAGIQWIVQRRPATDRSDRLMPSRIGVTNSVPSTARAIDAIASEGPVTFAQQR